MENPIVWTDDMNVVLPPGRTVKQVVDFIIKAALHGTPDDTIEQLIAAEFKLSPDDAALVRDHRTFGGIVRAATGNQVNCPDRAKDPMAWQSFQLATINRSIIARIYPQFVPPKPKLRDFISAFIGIPRLLLWEFKEWRTKRNVAYNEALRTQRLMNLVQTGKSVEAMKLYREISGASMEEAKAWLENHRS